MNLTAEQTRLVPKYSAMQFYVIQCNAMQFYYIQCNAVQCSIAIQCNAYDTFFPHPGTQGTEGCLKESGGVVHYNKAVGVRIPQKHHFHV